MLARGDFFFFRFALFAELLDLRIEGMHVERFLFLIQPCDALIGLQNLPLDMLDRLVFDLHRLMRLMVLFIEFIPLRLPVGHLTFRLLLRLLRHLEGFADAGQLRFDLGQFGIEFAQTRFIAFDDAARFIRRLHHLLQIAAVAFAQAVLVVDFLLARRNVSADGVKLALDFIVNIVGLGQLLMALLDQLFGLAHFGDGGLQLGFDLIEFLLLARDFFVESIALQ